jgi:hypothetical protein
MWVDRSESVEVPLPSTAERFLAVPTDISGVLNTSPTESQRICSHYVKRGLQTPFLEERLPGDLSISILHEHSFKIKIPAVYVKPFRDQFESKRKSEKKREVLKCLQQGMSQSTTPLTAVKPLRFP